MRPARSATRRAATRRAGEQRDSAEREARDTHTATEPRSRVRARRPPRRRGKRAAQLAGRALALVRAMCLYALEVQASTRPGPLQRRGRRALRAACPAIRRGRSHARRPQ
jgi:hypothetical protein